MIDFVITRRSDIRNVCKVCVMRGEDCDTDHVVVRAKLKTAIRKKVRMSDVTVPKRIDVAKLKDPDVEKELSDAFGSLSFDDYSWESFREMIFDASVDMLGLKKAKYKDWFNGSSVEINSLLDEKRKVHQKLLNCTDGERERLKIEYNNVRRNVQLRLRQIKNKWWLDFSVEVQTACDRKDSKKLYSLLHQAFGSKSSSVIPSKSKDGSTTFITPDKIMKRWTEHFTDLFFNPSLVDDAAIDSILQRDCIYSLDEEPSLDETINSIKQINTDKAPGLDGIPVELLRHDGENLNRAVHSLILDI